MACRFYNIGLNSRLFESLKQREDLMRHDLSNQLNDLNVINHFTDHFSQSFLVNKNLFADFSIVLFFWAFEFSIKPGDSALETNG